MPYALHIPLWGFMGAGETEDEAIQDAAIACGFYIKDSDVSRVTRDLFRKPCLLLCTQEALNDIREHGIYAQLAFDYNGVLCTLNMLRS